LQASAQEDARTIRNAIKGLGTDDAKLIGVITKRSNEQLVAITQEYTVCSNYMAFIVHIIDPLCKEQLWQIHL
jgi:Annexin